jgi:hypothetical protein
MLSEVQVSNSKQYIPPFFTLDTSQAFLKALPEETPSCKRGIVVSEKGLVSK